MSYFAVNMDKLVYNIIHMTNQPDNVKRTLLAKLVNSVGLGNFRALEKVDVLAVFDICLSVATSSDSEGTAQLAVFAFRNWAGLYKAYLKEYLTPERVTAVLASQSNAFVLLGWLKEVLCHLAEDTDVMCTLAPVSICFSCIIMHIVCILLLSCCFH